MEKEGQLPCVIMLPNATGREAATSPWERKRYKDLAILPALEKKDLSILFTPVHS